MVDLPLQIVDADFSQKSGLSLLERLRGKKLLPKLESSNLLVYAWLRKGSGWRRFKCRLDAGCWSRCSSGRRAACGALYASANGCGHRRCSTLNDLPCRACGSCHADLASVKPTTSSCLGCLDASLGYTSSDYCARNGRSSACWRESKQAAQRPWNVSSAEARRDGVLFLIDR